MNHHHIKSVAAVAVSGRSLPRVDSPPTRSKRLDSLRSEARRAMMAGLPPPERYDTLADAEAALQRCGFALLPDSCDWRHASGLDAGVYPEESGSSPCSAYRIEYSLAESERPDRGESAQLAAPTRRAFISLLGSAAAAAASVTVLVASVPAVARPAEIDALYEFRTELAAEMQELLGAYQAATEAMPWWARPGREYLRGDGTWLGAIVGWPAIDDGTMPSRPHFIIKKRPSPADIRQDCDADVRLWGNRHRPGIRAHYTEQMKALAQRLQLQGDEERKAGLPELDARMTAIAEQISDIDERIANLEVPAADLAQKAAAVHLTSLVHRLLTSEPVGDVSVLEALHPALRGLILEHAELAMQNWDASISSMPFYGA